MKFKELKPYICTDVTLVIGKIRVYPVTVMETEKWDNYEVIGVRVDTDRDDCLLISLKKPLLTDYVNVDRECIKECTNYLNQCKE